MKQAGRKVYQDIELSPGRDYEVLRGQAYRFHEKENCVQCKHIPLGQLKLHVIRQSGRHPVKRPMAISSPPFELYLLPKISLRQNSAPAVSIQAPRLPAHIGSLGALGNFLDDIFSFISDIINSVLNAIESVLKAVMHGLAHPLDGLKALIQFNLDLMSGKTFMDIFANFPLTRWLYLGLDNLTGGFLSNLTILTSLPGRFATGQPISRAELLKALSAFKVILVVAIGVLTGGATLAIIGAAAGLLKAGPLGKTALGRTLLDIAAIGAGAYMGDANIISAFINAGQDKLTNMGLVAAAAKLGISAVVVGLTSMAVSTAAKSGDSSDETSTDESGTASEPDQPAENADWNDSGTASTAPASGDTSNDAAPGAEGENSTPPSDTSASNESATSNAPSTDSNEPTATQSESDSIESGSSHEEAVPSDTQTDTQTQETQALDEQDASSEEEDDTQAESGISDDDLASILKAGLSLTNLASTLLKEGYTPKQAVAATNQAKRLQTLKKVVTLMPVKKAILLTPAQAAAQKQKLIMGAGIALVILAALTQRKKE